MQHYCGMGVQPWHDRPVADSLLAEIVGNALQAVTFSGGGVKLDFGDAWFTAHCWPSASIGSNKWALGDRGYRDALCAFISHEVTGFEASRQAGVVLAFGLGRVVTNPHPGEVHGPEIAQLSVYDPMYQRSHLEVWRVGEGPFSGTAWS